MLIGWWSALRRIRRHSSASTTAFHCFPLRYFEVHGLNEPDWPSFLDDFLHHWPTDEDHTYVDFVREGSAGNGACADRQCSLATADRGTGRRGEVGVSFRRAGIMRRPNPRAMPGFRWLRFMRRELGDPRCISGPSMVGTYQHGRSAIAEVYPALWSPRISPVIGRTGDQHDAHSIAAWLSRAATGMVHFRAS